MFRALKNKFLRKKSSALEREFIFLGGELNLPSRDLRTRSRTEWVESVFFDFDEEKLSRADKNYLGVALNGKKLAGFLFMVIFGLVLLLGRAAYLQVARGNYYFGLAEQNRLRVFNLSSPRGIIYDLNGRSLVKNVPNFTVFITPYDLHARPEGVSETVDWLHTNLGEEIKEPLSKILAISQKSKEYFGPVFLEDGLDYEKALAMRIMSVDHPGVGIEVMARREYLAGEPGKYVGSFSHILGYEGRIDPGEFAELKNQGYLLNDYIGKTGVEASYEKLLRGRYGKEQVEIDSTGRAVKIIAKEDMVKGDNLYLSIDYEMQAKLEEIMTAHLRAIGKQKASAIVMNPQTGKIYSLISLPSFDNNLFAAGIERSQLENLLNNANQPLFNRAISGEYPSGSTIKPVISAAALEEGIIDENKSFLSVGGIKIGQWFFPDWKAGGHGVTNVRKAIADSVNSFFYIIGGGYGEFKGLGVYKIKEWAEKFGLGRKTGINLPNEQSGFLPTPEWRKDAKKEPWYIGDTYHLSIGQGDLLVTPLQVANYTAVFANGGKLFQPQIIDRYFDQEKNQEVKIESEILRQNFISAKSLNIVRQGMRQAVTGGSAKILNSLPVKAAAKTGTAQFGENKKPHAWFISFAPYDNAEIVVVVMVEESGEGSSVAAPIAYEFMNWYFYKK